MYKFNSNQSSELPYLPPRRYLVVHHKAFPVLHLLQQSPNLHLRSIWAARCQTLLSSRLMVHCLWWLELVSSSLVPSPWHPPAPIVLTQPLVRLHWKLPHQTQPGCRSPRKKSRETAWFAWGKALKNVWEETAPQKQCSRSRISQVPGNEVPLNHFWSAAFLSDVKVEKCPSCTALFFFFSVILVSFFLLFKHF